MIYIFAIDLMLILAIIILLLFIGLYYEVFVFIF
jgi:hypothetical protein